MGERAVTARIRTTLLSLAAGWEAFWEFGFVCLNADATYAGIATTRSYIARYA